MAEYRLYFMAPSTRHILRVREFEAETDQAAVASAETQLGEAAMELWFTGRKIQRWEPVEGVAPGRWRTQEDSNL